VCAAKLFSKKMGITEEIPKIAVVIWYTCCSSITSFSISLLQIHLPDLKSQAFELLTGKGSNKNLIKSL